MAKAAATRSIAQLLIYVAVVTASPALAKASESIESSRPGVAIGANLVPVQSLQIETGFQYLTTQSSEKSSQRTSITEIRYGLNPSFELTSEIDYENKHLDGEPNEEGFSDIELGVKVRLIDDSQKAPSLFLRARLQLPGGDGEFTQNHPAPNAVLASGYEFTDRVSIEGDIGARYNPDEGVTEGFYALNLSHEISERTSVFIEGYHSLEDENGAIEGDLGAAYLVTPNFQFDFSLGWGHNDGQVQNLVSCGLSYRHL